MSTQQQLGLYEAVAMPKPTLRCSQKTGQQLKKEGQARAAGKHSESLRIAKEWAVILGKNQPIVTIEHVRARYELITGREWDLGNAAGMVFADRDVWEWAGFVNSLRPSSHSRIIRTWRLKR